MSNAAAATAPARQTPGDAGGGDRNDDRFGACEGDGGRDCAGEGVDGRARGGDRTDGRDGDGDGSRTPGTAADAGATGWGAVAALLGVGTALAAGAALGAGAPAAALDWRPALVAAEPWRAWSAAFVHLSALHLAANAAGLLLVAALGAVARVPARIALAWFVAWPLAHLGLLAEPALARYGGLSGVLHAGVAAAALHLAWRGAGARRGVGLALLAGLALKVIAEAPWAQALRHPAGWDIAVAPAAHACGALAGLLCAAAAEAAHGWRGRHGRS